MSAVGERDCSVTSIQFCQNKRKKAFETWDCLKKGNKDVKGRGARGWGAGSGEVRLMIRFPGFVH